MVFSLPAANEMVALSLTPMPTPCFRKLPATANLRDWIAFDVIHQAEL